MPILMSDARLHADADAAALTRLSSRFVAPVAVTPHVAGAAVDLTLVEPGNAVA
jgi:zinc D-Ala-D-Ala dipeptidase